eukprot:m.29086 g.29086  ORF g.29086 m.29086 type:complete len:108 (+) comp5052_c0_seq1:139-462(+)
MAKSIRSKRKRMFRTMRREKMAPKVMARMERLQELDRISLEQQKAAKETAEQESAAAPEAVEEVAMEDDAADAPEKTVSKSQMKKNKERRTLKRLGVARKRRGGFKW